MKIFIFLSIAIVIVILYILFISFLAFSKGYSIQDMDWNNDGTTDVFEMLKSKDIGLRRVNDKCIEYFYLKDGIEAKVVCQ